MNSTYPKHAAPSLLRFKRVGQLGQGHARACRCSKHERCVLPMNDLKQQQIINTMPEGKKKNTTQAEYHSPH